LTDDVKHARKAKTNNIVALEDAWWTLHSDKEPQKHKQSTKLSWDMWIKAAETLVISPPVPDKHLWRRWMGMRCNVRKEAHLV
jgi:hypothetical protein